MARPSNTIERRAQIVRGLMSAMAEHGYEGATIAKIARAAGLSPGLVHYHFETKANVLLALVATLTEGLADRVAERHGGATNPRDRLRGVLDAFVATGEGADPSAVAAWVLIGSEALKQDVVRVAWRGAVSAAVEAIELAVEAVLLDEDRDTDDERAHTIALALFAAIQGAYQLAAATPELLPSGFFADAAWRMAVGLIEGPLP
jgi:TetR/AcrR family transcriptional repressor of bet genes